MTKGLERKLTLRYLCALGLIATFSITTYAVLTQRASTSASDASLINTAGMQRMLSQRIALSALQAARADSPDSVSAAIERLKDAAAKMSHNHDQLKTLTNASDGTDFGAATLTPDAALDRQITTFLLATQDAAEALRRDPTSDTAVDALETLNTLLNRNLVENLDGYVSALQAHSEAGVRAFLRLETMFLIGGLSVLLIEAVFIFRPMVKRIVQAISALQTTNHELTTFSYRISHDLRAPVASTLGLVRIGRNAISKDTSPLIGDILTKIDATMQRMDTLIADIITVKKNKQPADDLQLVDVNALIDDVFDKLAPLADEHAVSLEHSLSPGETVMTSKTYLRQIVDNLVSNGIKYRDPESPKPFLSVSLRRTNDACDIVVEDNGLGVPESAQDQLFAMFKRFHPNTSFGSGLGLYLVKQNAERIGGSIRYEPKCDGSRFTFSLPESR
ncbi:MAG: ATP-binding protein [Pseudomonadota bacterium]